MGYRIRPGKPFAQEVRTVAREQFEHAITCLDARPQGLHEAIHDARKCFKRIRALYRLTARDEPDFRKTENARIRDMAAMLATERDATALVEVLAYLCDRAKTTEEAEALARIRVLLTARRDQLVADEADLEDKTRTAIALCRDALEALETLHFEDGKRRTSRRLGHAWKTTLKQAREALNACGTGETNAFHEMRKRAQDYWMHLSLLRALWPSAMQAKQVQAKALVDLLGHEHDLSVLSALINENPRLFGKSDDLSHLLSTIIERQQVLREEALTLGGGVFGDDPEEESARIALLWRRAAS